MRWATRDDRGGAAVEFALLAPVLVLLLVGIVETGRLMWTRTSLQFAAEEASRFALARADAGPAQIAERARGRLAGMNPTAVQVVVASNTAEISVTVSASFAFMTQGLLPVGPLALSATSRLPRN